ncbi:MAG: hypothetical protein K6E88_00845 [Lachnospiraceae bacterium]|nr:hypothetical protein [Lachnospiraceae bacterium]
MSINSYGLFNNGQSGSPYNDRNYELQRQLEARKQQLGDLDRMPSLTAAQQQKRQQLLNAVDQLSGKLEGKTGTVSDKTSSLNSIGRRDTEDGIVIPKHKMEAVNAYSQIAGSRPKRPNPGYAENEYSNSDRVIYKNPGRYDGSATTPGDTYLKGFFVDIKL